jgi:hypothetical protein
MTYEELMKEYRRLQDDKIEACGNGDIRAVDWINEQIRMVVKKLMQLEARSI